MPMMVVIFSCCRPIIISFIAVSSFLVVLQLFFLCLVVMSFYCLVTMKLCRFFIVFRFQPVILSSCRKITLSSSDYDIFILSSCHPVVKLPLHLLFYGLFIT